MKIDTSTDLDLLQKAIRYVQSVFVSRGLDENTLMEASKEENRSKRTAMVRSKCEGNLHMSSADCLMVEQTIDAIFIFNTRMQSEFVDFMI